MPPFLLTAAARKDILDIGRDAEDIKPGYKKFSEGSHIIFYRAGTQSKIVVIRILHNSMDIDRHL